jgi:flagellar biosynthesis protein FlhF
MNTVKIIAESAQEALEQVQAQVGPDAVILNVRKLSADGVKKLWASPQIEVLATTSQKESSERESLQQLATKVQQLDDELHARGITTRETLSSPEAKLPPKLIQMIRDMQGDKLEDSLLPAVQVLEQIGLLPSHARWLSAQSRNFLGATKPRNLPEEMELLREVLSEYWHQLARRVEKPGNPVRVLVGTPGSGKTTVLAKWATQATFLQQRPSRIWRLDTDRPNTAEFLSLHGEMLQVPVERVWDLDEQPPEDTLRLVDFPGVAADQSDSLEALAQQVKDLGETEIHLVLNAAYDLGLSLRQAKAFSLLPLSGVILTHVDEAERWSKVWNVMLATQLPVTYLSGGQNIPGDFHPAIPEPLFDAWISSAMNHD